MPKIAYNIVYNNLARQICSHSFYMFNFIESRNIIENYVEKVKNIQDKDSYVLMGYSFGGALAFEVAQELIKHGGNVTDVILIDSYIVNEKSFHKMDESFVRSQAENFLSNDHKGLISSDPDLMKKISDSFVNYFNYTKDIVNTLKPIPANIHLIRGWGKVDQIVDTRDM